MLQQDFVSKEASGANVPVVEGVSGCERRTAVPVVFVAWVVSRRYPYMVERKPQRGPPIMLASEPSTRYLPQPQ